MAERNRKIEELFHAALELEPGQRDSFLSSACRDDSALRAEIEALIAADERSSSFMNSPAYHAGGLIETRAHPIGILIGHYKVIDLLGRGGMGEVYRAQDERLNRYVAIKFLSSELANESARRRFQQEARMASALNHPHILT